MKYVYRCWLCKSFLIFMFSLLSPIQARMLPSDVLDALEYAYDLGGPEFSYEYNYAMEEIGQGAFDFPEKKIEKLCTEALRVFYAARESLDNDIDLLTSALKREVVRNIQIRAARPESQTNGVTAKELEDFRRVRDLDVQRDLNVGRTLTAQEINVSGSTSNLNVANLSVSNTATINNAVINTATVQGTFTAQNGYYFNTGVPGVQANVLQVTKGSLAGPNQFNSIKTAVDSITDASATKPYVVEVGPGLYLEDTITLKPFVAVVGYSASSTLVMASSSAIDVFVGAPDSCLSNIFITGATGTDKSAIVFTGDTGGRLFEVKDCSFGANYRQVSVVAAAGDLANILVESCVFIDEFVRGFHLDGTNGRVFLSTTSILWNVENSTLLSELCFITGPNARMRMGNSCFSTQTVLTANGFVIQNGANCAIESTRFCKLNRALYVPNVGAGPDVFLQALSAFNCTEDIRIDNPLTDAVINGIVDWSKTFIDSSADVSLSILDPEPSGGVVIVGPQQAGSSIATVTNISPQIERGGPLGVITGGTLSATGALQVTVAQGTGYVSSALKYVEWNAQAVSLDPNKEYFIFIDENGVAQKSEAEPNYEEKILIGKARTGATNIVYIQLIAREAQHTSTQLDDSWRQAFGNIYSSGSLVAKNGNLALDVTQGRYFFGTIEYNPSGGTAITWDAFYRDGGAGGYTNISQSLVDYQNYDNGTGALVPIPGGQFARHALYIVNDGVNEKYLLQYGQELYTTLLEAQNGSLPPKPGIWTGNIASIASIIVENTGAVSGNSVREIIDERPTLSFKAGGVSSVTNHGDLSGLLDDDHPQYLLVSGTRAMAGSLNMGANPITNVGLVDGVDVSAHGAARHIPNGLDPLPTAAPVTIGTSNQEGIQNSFARSDHVHSHGNLAGGTLHADATTTVDGFMSAADKTKLDSLDPAVFVLKAGDTMTGTLNFNATGSNALVVNTNKLVVDNDTGNTTVGGTLDVTGQTTLSSNLDMGGQSITNVNLVDGVDVPAHASRHNPGGADALATAAPVTISTANSEGTAASFARSDHVHNHGNLAGGALHADATTTVDGFMSAADKTKLDGLQPGGSYVLKAGDTMTGTLNINAGLSSALVVNTNKLIVDSTTGNTTIGGTLDVTGQTTLSNLSSTGVVHNNASGVLSTSLIVNADVDNAAGIVDTKLATISTAGKVSNSATTATSANTASAIVARDGSGNFSAGTISANLTGNVTGAASLNVLKAGDTMSGDLNMGGQSIINVNLVDGVDVPAHASRHNPGGADALATAAPVTIATANSEGTAASFARSDHVHNHGNLAGGALHADATTTVDGFMSAADKTKLDGLQPGGSYVLKAGDTMTGTLNINAPTSNALVVNTNKLVVDNDTGNTTVGGTLGVTGQTTLSNLSSTGVVHNNASGVLSTSLIVNADVDNAAGIVDTKLATISTAGKVANSATTATSANTASAIVARDGSGNFSAGTISANLTGDVTGSVTGAASLNVLKAGDTMSGDLNMGGQSITNVNLVDGVDVPAHASRHNPGGADALATAAPVTISTANSEGTAASFARSDHVHNHGNLAGGALHADATTTVDGFMSAADKTKLDGLQPGGSYVLKAGDTMTGTLNINAGVSNALVVNTNKLVVDSTTGNTTVGGTLGVTGQTTLSNLSSTGVVHNNASGVLSTSLIVNADVDNAAGIVDTKLATISTAGKVSNSATTATSGLGPNTIVARDVSNDFSAGTITASLTGAASLNVLKAGDTMSGDLNMGGQSITNVNLVDGVDVPAHASRHNPGGADALATAAPVTISTANSEGTAASFARSDHVHNHGNLAGGALHADATTTVDGFMSAADKTKLDGLQPGGSYVLKAGDSMTGTLNITAAGSNALVVNTNKLVVDSDTGNTTVGGALGVTGQTTLSNLSSTGVVHNNASGVLSTSLIVNADVDNAAGIVDTKLDTISTAGKVSNSATTATSANTASAIVARDGSGNFSAGTISADLTGSVTGAASLNVLKAGDTMTGTLNINAGVSNALVVNTNKLVVDSTTGNTTVGGTLGVTGQTTLSNLSSTGVVHNNASGVLSTSLIVNADVDNAAGIVDTKLATISTAGKVSNSATTATSVNTASAIVARDGSGNFSAGTISANLTGDVTGSVTGAASLNVLKAGDTMSGDLSMGGQSITNVNLVDGVDVPAHASRHNPGGADALATAAPVTIATANSEGTAASFARSDHVHSHGNLAGGALHADATTTVDGFMSAADKTKLDGLQPGGSYVLKAGDTMTGTLNINAPTSNALVVNTNKLVVDNDTGNTTVGGTLGVTGQTTLSNLSSTGVVHNNASGVLSTSLIVNADVDNAAGIVDTKLATISTAGKVSNSATTATSANTASAIVARDGSGNFSAGTISANLTGDVTGSVTGAASLNVLKAGDTMTGTLNINAGVSNALVVNTNKLVVDSTTGNTTVGGTLGVTGQTTLSNLSSTGVVHNNASGVLSTSLIVNADVDNAAGIVDTKLATISTAGKVSNSATTATSANTASAIVARDGSGNFSAGTISADLTGSVTGAASLNVLKAGDTMTGTLNINAPTSNALVVNTNKLVVDNDTGNTTVGGTLGVTGQTTLSNLSSTGVVHNNASGVLSTSLIVNADVDNAAGIVDTKLATISTAGKVANSATTATSANTASAIVARDGSGNFSAGTISADLTGSVTGAASLNVLKAGDTMTGTLNITAAGSNALVVNTNKLVVDSDSGDTTMAGNLYLPETASSTTGIVYKNSNRFIHTRDNTNSNHSLFVGVNSGSLSSTAATANTGIGYQALTVIATGDNNTALGYNALSSNQAGANNVAVGYNALTANTASNNTAIGSGALDANAGGTPNTAVGYNALGANILGTNNVAVGDSALSVNTANFNTAIGSSALILNSSGEQNVAVGYNALSKNTTNNHNTAIGTSALAANTAASNTAIGSAALFANTTGTPNTAIGHNALTANTTGNNNIAIGNNSMGLSSLTSNNLAIGHSALSTLSPGTVGWGCCNTAVGHLTLQNTVANLATEGTNNTAVGYNALNANTSGHENTAVGTSALDSNQTGTSNVAVGYNALGANVSGTNNVAVGDNALLLSTVSNNTAVGSGAAPAVTSGAANVAVGTGALSMTNTQSFNTAVGYNALAAVPGSNENTAVGSQALTAATGSTNTAVGSKALGGTGNTGSSNVAIGFNTMDANNQTGDDNVAVGSQALGSATSAASNVAVGSSAGDIVTTGNQNTLVGKDAGGGLTTGSDNVLLGYSAGSNIITGTGNVIIGSGAATSAGGFNEIVIGESATGLANDTIVIGNTATVGCYIKGIDGVTVTGGTTMYIDSNGQLGTSTSSRRFKENIETIESQDNDLMQLRPVHFNYISDETKQTRYGLIAEEVEDVYPELVSYDQETGLARGVLYDNFISLLISKIQKQETRIERLESVVQEFLEKQIIV